MSQRILSHDSALQDSVASTQNPSPQHSIPPFFRLQGFWCRFCAFSRLLVSRSETLLPTDTSGGAVSQYSSHLTFTYQTGSTGNAPDLYLGGAPFETRPRHRLHCLWIFVVLLTPSATLLQNPTYHVLYTCKITTATG
jgi:hypothetical protein